MVGSPKGQLSLDTNLVLDFARGQDFAHDFREEFQKRGYILRLSPTVLAELEYLILFGIEKNRRLAQVAAKKVESWFLTPFNLPEVHHAVAESFARRLRDRQLILGETALAQIPLLVTSDKHLLDIEEDALLSTLKASDLPVVRAVHPKGLLRALR
jgi:predicted nucleic acid-binding protein